LLFIIKIYIRGFKISIDAIQLFASVNAFRKNEIIELFVLKYDRGFSLPCEYVLYIRLADFIFETFFCENYGIIKKFDIGFIKRQCKQEKFNSNK